jgi:hypothetical protein
MASKEVIGRALQKLWSVKLGKPTLNEASSSRWILVALSDFNGEREDYEVGRILTGR